MDEGTPSLHNRISNIIRTMFAFHDDGNKNVFLILMTKMIERLRFCSSGW